MIITFISKIAILIGTTIALVVSGTPAPQPSNSAQAAVVRFDPFHWKYVTPEWRIPAADFATAFQADYQAPQSEYGAGHRGIDFRSAIGTVVRTPVAGKVIEIAQVGYRNVITVLGNDGRLATMEPVCAAVKLNAIVYASQVIGKTCTPQPGYIWHCELCVHLSAREAGEYLSPMLLMGMFRPSVLKPNNP